MIIELFSRPGSHLCDEARHRLSELIERNVEDKEKRESQFGQEIPVVFINGRKAIKYRATRTALERYFLLR